MIRRPNENLVVEAKRTGRPTEEPVEAVSMGSMSVSIRTGRNTSCVRPRLSDSSINQGRPVETKESGRSLEQDERRSFNRAMECTQLKGENDTHSKKARHGWEEGVSAKKEDQIVALSPVRARAVGRNDRSELRLMRTMRP